MYEIYFYKDKNGKEPVKEYIAGLAAKKDKDKLALSGSYGLCSLAAEEQGCGGCQSPVAVVAFDSRASHRS